MIFVYDLKCQCIISVCIIFECKKLNLSIENHIKHHFKEVIHPSNLHLNLQIQNIRTHSTFNIKKKYNKNLGKYM